MSTQSKPEGNGAGVDDEVVCGCDEILEDKQDVTSKKVLCVSCPSANEFSAIFFLLFARSSSNSTRSFQCFRRTLVPNFIQIRQWVKNFP